jgi:hypothetical protein
MPGGSRPHLIEAKKETVGLNQLGVSETGLRWPRVGVFLPVQWQDLKSGGKAILPKLSYPVRVMNLL